MALTPRKVIQCDRAGNDLRSFSSAKEAASFFNSNCPSAVQKAIRHGTCAFGYRWRYEGEPLYIRLEGTPGKRRRIVAVSQTDGKETTYPSLSDASRQLGIGITAIESSLLMGCLAKGYRFRYEGEEMAESFKNKKHRQAVVAIDDDGNIVKEFPSAYEAAKELGVIHAAIYRCLSPRNPDAKCKGFRLRYKKD